MAEFRSDHHRDFSNLNLVVLKETLVRNHGGNSSLWVLLSVLNLANLNCTEDFCLVS